MYSDLYLKSQKNSILVISAVVVLAILGFYLYFTRENSPPSQAVSKVLKRHEIVNVSTQEVGVFWQSFKKEQGWIIYGDSPQKLSLVAIDERDVGNKKNSEYYHYVILKNLRESTTYFYKIVNGDRVFLSPGNLPFTVKTPKSFSVSSNIQPAYGKVLLKNGQPAQNAFVLFFYKNTVPFLTLTKITGEWLIPLQSAVDKDTSQAILIDGREKAKIEIINDDGLSSTIEALVQKTNPLPQTIVLGKDYKFLEASNILPASTTRTDNSKDYPISIIYPKENALIPGEKPLLKGLAIPGKQVKVTIPSQPGYVSRITTNSVGEWKISVPVSFPPGSYTLTISTVDKRGNAVSLSRKFSIAKSGEQVLAVATPSGIVTATPTLEPTSVISPTTSLTITVTVPITSVPTITIPLETVTPIYSPTPTVTLIPGFNTNPILFGSIGLIILGAGVLLIF